MSVGRICSCPKRDHPEPPWVVADRAAGKPDRLGRDHPSGGCRKYADSGGNWCSGCRNDCFPVAPDADHG